MNAEHHHQDQLPQRPADQHKNNPASMARKPEHPGHTFPEPHTGTQYTRRTLPGGQLAQMGAPFHAMTRTEYVIARRGGWREEQLAGLAARISEQAAMWDGRTNLPAPLHLAKSADEKHPGFVDQEGLSA
ncbi:RNaseH domain-containing protein [Streptomyces sp. NPDC002845]